MASTISVQKHNEYILMKEFFKVTDGILSVNHKKVELPYLIRGIESVDNLLIVLLEPPSDVAFNRNVFAISQNGECIWQIEESPHGGDRAKPYLSLSLDGSGGISVENWIGVRYDINLMDGSVVAKAFNRF